MLNSQVQVYSIKTNSFFTEEELYLSREINCCKRKIKLIEQFTLLSFKVEVSDEDKFRLNEKFDSINDFCRKNDEDEEYNLFINKLYSKNDKIIKSKEFKEVLKDTKHQVYKDLLKEFDDEFNLALEENIDVRILNPRRVSKYKIVSLFDSFLIRTLELEINKISKDLLIVEVYHYDIMNQLIKNGCTYLGEQYIFYTASSGQIRQKKLVMVKEDIWNKHKLTLMCGLTIEDINNSEYGGCNPNKYLSYLALDNSATDKWDKFNIDKAIVIEDFETLVTGDVDYIDGKTFIAERKNMDILIVHSDGCGWILPSESKKNFMIRLPWMKGLLTSVDYLSWCKNYNNGNYNVLDIYGKEWDLLKDDIKYVLSKSQFKMWKYYPNQLDENGEIIKYGWDDYKEKFKLHNCHASICNVEPNKNKFENKTVPYQMWQTLIDITPEEVEYFTKPTIEYLTRARTEREFMLNILGCNNEKKNYLQQALNVYPELLADKYVKDELSKKINSIKNKAKYAKFKVDCKYIYILPDVFAWMQYSLSGNKNPIGLLKDGEVSCKLYEDGKEVSVNRNPHLYKEWAIRNNVVDYTNENWFTTNGVYVSCHDLISKLIMNDWDGDTSLIIGDDILVQRAKLCMEGVVPLYYEMGVAKPKLINPDNIYDSLRIAFDYGNIGKYSNKLTTIWNSEHISIDAVKAIVAENNFSIDAAKTLIMPKPVGEMVMIIADSVKRKIEIKSVSKKGKEIVKIRKEKIKLPYFFQFVKQDCKNVEPINTSTVNQICAEIENMKQKRYNFSQIPDFRYDTLLGNKKIKINQIVIDEYLSLNKEMQNYFRVNNSEEFKKEMSRCVWDILSYQFMNFCLDENIKYSDAVDMVIKYIYNDKKLRSGKKEFLFSVLGDVIVENLIKNIGTDSMLCSECNRRTKRKSNRQTMCPDCAKEIKKMNDKNRNKK